MVGALIAFLGPIFAKLLTEGVVKFVALKAAMLFLFVFVLPAVLLKVFFWFKTYLLGLVVDLIDAEIPGGFDLGAGMVQLTGIAAYIGGHLNLAEGVAVLVSCALAGWIVRIVRG